jgi:large conductance mechanosensitive channel
MTKFINEFKEFALKGNMIDIAIGVIIGTAFNKVVDIIVKQILLPPLSLLTGGARMENKKIVLRELVTLDGIIQTDEIAIGYGKFIEASIDFFIICLTIFVVVKFMNQLKDKSLDATDSTVTTPKDIELLDRMTELLEEQNKLLENNNS